MLTVVTALADSLKMVRELTNAEIEGVLTDEPESTFACMKQAYDLGINFFDTAERCVTSLTCRPPAYSNG